MDVKEIMEKISYKKDILKFRAKTNWYKLKDWCTKNPQMAVTLTGGLIAGVKFIGKNAIHYINLKKEAAVKDLYCYDRSLGHYWALRRELTNKEWLEIDQRKSNGERLADILEEMRVLK